MNSFWGNDFIVKMNSEMFLGRSFMYVEKDQECLTIPANGKIESVLRRTSTSLYEKKGKS